VEGKNNSDTSNNSGNWNHLIPFRKYLNNILQKQKIKELQKTAIFGHCTHNLESTNLKVQNIQVGK
jgi:hypothetical protein